MNSSGLYGTTTADHRSRLTTMPAADAPPPPPANHQAYDDLMQSSAAGQAATVYATGGQPQPQSSSPSFFSNNNSNNNNSLEGNMAELLEAAAKATSESQRQQQLAQQNLAGGGLRKVARNMDLRGAAMLDEALAAGQKRKRTGTPDDEVKAAVGGEEGSGGVVEEGGGGGRAGSQSPRKRARQTPQAAEVQSATPMSTTTTTAAEAMGNGYQQSAGVQLQQQQQQQQSQPQQAGFAITDARAVGVHSAAALFRQPSAGSAAKKHTRPPMSKLFASLQLTPENFLRLQAAAKSYMLDEAHPERQNCVGSRGKGDTDMVKLRLFNCCRDFLNDGIGDRFFGPDVPPPTENEVLEGETTPGRKWLWPRDGNKIVSLVTPLLRRMVTNERQRQYAQETRKGAGKKKDAARESSQDVAATTAATPSTPMDAQGSPQNPAIDPALSTPQSQAYPQNHQQQSQHPGYGPPPTQYPRFLQSQPPSSIYTAGMPSGNHFHHHHHHQPPPDQNVIQVLITRNNTKLLPRIDMPSWPSTPYHTLPLADLRRAVEEEVRGLLKRGLDLGIRRKSLPAAAKGEDQRPRSQGQDSGGAGSAEEPGDAAMEGIEQEQHQVPIGEQANGNAAEDGRGPSAQQQQQQQQQHQQQDTTAPNAASAAATAAPLEDEPSLDGITLEIRALTGRGLVLITSEDEWRAVLAETGRAVWMEGVLRIVVEVI